MKQILHLSFKKSLMLVAFAIFTSLSFQAKADTNGDWEYEIMGQYEDYPDAVRIIGYNGTSSTVSIPGSMIVGYIGGVVPDVRTVREIRILSNENTHVQTLTIPSNVRIVTTLNFPNVTSLTINNGVEELNIGLLNKLQTVHIPSSVTDLSDLGDKVTTITSSSSNYPIVSGILYEGSSKSTLHTYPRSGGSSTFTIPSYVNTLARYAFKNNSTLSRVNINYDNLTFDGYQSGDIDWILNAATVDPYKNGIYTIVGGGHLYAAHGTVINGEDYGGPYVATSSTSTTALVNTAVLIDLDTVFSHNYRGHNYTITYTAQRPSESGWVDIGTITDGIWTFTPTADFKPISIRFRSDDGYFDATHNISIIYREPLEGDVTINGTLEAGSELTAVVSNTNNSGTFSYLWKRNGIMIKNEQLHQYDAASYTLVQEDINKNIMVIVSSSFETGSITSSSYGPIEKFPYNGSLTAQVNVDFTGENSVTVSSANYNVEYGATTTNGTADDVSYQSETQLTTYNGSEAMQPSTTYRIYYRYQATSTHQPSPALGYVEATTDEEGTSLSGTIALSTDCDNPATIVGTVTLDPESTSELSDLSYAWKKADGSSVPFSSTYGGVSSASITPAVEIGNCYLEVTSSVQSGSIISETINITDIAGLPAPTSAPEIFSEGPYLGRVALVNPEGFNSSNHDFQYTFKEDESPVCSYDGWTYNPTNISGLTPGTTVRFYKRNKGQVIGPDSYAASPASPALVYEVPKATLTFTLKTGSNPEPLVNTIVRVNNTEYTTDANGVISINDLLSGRFDYVIFVTGYDSEAGNKTITNINHAVTLVLEESTSAALTGTVTISGTLQYGEELTASVSETNNTGTLSYQWKRDGLSISGATSETYTLSESDITKSISVDVTSSVETGTISSVGTAAIEKADKAAPAAPSLASKTHNSITLTAVEGCEYYESLELGTRQSSPEFTNLVANTGYDFQQRYVETATHKTSPWSGITSIATDEEPINALTGTVTISGNLQYGEELTAEVSETNNTGTLSYQWKRDGSSISGASSSSYTLSESDISKSISIEVSSSVETGSISSTGTAAIEKADKAAPAAPSLASKTHNSITLNVVENCEYAIVDAMSTVNMDDLPWQTSAGFSELLPETEYNCFQRLAETTTHNASQASDSFSVTTDEDQPTTFSVTIFVTDGVNPVENAQVQLENTGTKYTDENGQVVYLNLYPTTYGFWISADGYEDYSCSVSVSNSNVVENVELVRPALTGTVIINGTLQFGEELTLAVSETNNTGTLSYQWKRDGSNISGATSTSYTLAEADIFKSISVEVTSSVQTGTISSTGTAAIEKADQVAPVAPSLASKTHNSITLNAVEGCEYAIDAGTWQSSVEFTGLNSATSYSLTQRYVETNTHKASAASSVLNVETETAPANALTGTVTISGSLQYGKELTATVSETNNTGTLSYQWKHDGSNISGATSTSYTLAEADIFKSISVEVSSSVETGSISSTGTAAIEKADQVAPAIPTLASKTHNSIILNAVEGCEYAIDAGTWQSSVEFTGLSAATSYSLTQRYVETTTHKASAASEMLLVTTDEEPAESYSVTFNISGETKSLTNLIVIFDGTEYTVNDNGTSVIENILPGTYDYSITAQGFIEHASSVTIEDQDVNLDVVLKLATAIDDVNKVNIKAYPNPAVNYIVVSGVSEGEDLMLFDLIGNKVIHRKVQSTKEQLDLSSISSGIYFIKAGNKTVRIIKR